MAAVSHVALNAAFLDPNRSGGPETYLRGLVPALASARPTLRIDLITTRRGAAQLSADGWDDIVEIVRLNADDGERLRRLLAEELFVAREARRRHAQLLHSLASVGPARAGLPHV